MDFVIGVTAEATATAVHPPAESMTAAERQHLGIGDDDNG